MVRKILIPKSLPHRALPRIGRWVLAVAIAIIFVWSGGQKMFGTSPVESLVRKCAYTPLDDSVVVSAWGAIEVAAGLLLLVPWLWWMASLLLISIAAGAISVFFVTPRVCFNIFHAPWVLSETGHYLVMTIGLAAGGMLVVARRTGGS